MLKGLELHLNKRGGDLESESPFVSCWSLVTLRWGNDTPVWGLNEGFSSNRRSSIWQKIGDVFKGNGCIALPPSRKKRVSNQGKLEWQQMMSSACQCLYEARRNVVRCSFAHSFIHSFIHIRRIYWTPTSSTHSPILSCREDKVSPLDETHILYEAR